MLPTGYRTEVLSQGERIGEWVVEEPLGHGGMATVYRCHHVMTPRMLAAVKVFRLSVIGDDKWFRREAETLAGLRHPCIVRILHPGKDDARGLLFLAMELVSGRTLRQVLGDGPMPSDTSRAVFHGVSDALAYAHLHKIYHRDIKPSNILLRPSGAPTVLDFGIATDPERADITGEHGIGTPAYMAPEAFGGTAVDLATGDVYGVGVLLYEALTGQRAFPVEDGLSDAARAFRLITRKQAVAELDPGDRVEPELRRIVRAATAREPERRPASMEELAELLGGGRPWIDPDESAYRMRGRRRPEDSLSPIASVAPTPVPATAGGDARPAGADRGSFWAWVIGGVLAALVLGVLAGGLTWWWVVSRVG